MSFRVGVVLVAILSANVLFADNGEDFLSVGGVAMSRPLVLRSDFATKDVIRRFMCRAQWKTPESTARFVGRHANLCKDFFHDDFISACRNYVNGELSVPPIPQLKNGSFCEVGLGFDSYGGSKFGKVILTKKISFFETEFIEDLPTPTPNVKYRPAMNKYIAKLVAAEPERYKGTFSDETIQQYVNWAKNGKGALNNPVLADGSKTAIHHDVAHKQLQLMTKTEHVGTQSLPSKGHGSGTNFSGGGELSWARRQSFPQYLKTAAARWGGIAGFDLLISTAGLATTETNDKNQYVVNTGSVAAAYLSATISESLFCNAFPAAVGTTPAWAGFIPMLSGGVASWVASGVYFITRQAIMYGWNQHQLAQARRIEESCKIAEKRTRLSILGESVEYNSETLNNIVRSVCQ